MERRGMEPLLKWLLMILDQLTNVFPLMVAQLQAFCYAVCHLGANLLMTIEDIAGFETLSCSPFANVVKETSESQQGTARCCVDRRQEMVVYIT